ncbi:HEPN domain-containing protein [Streptomyces sp. NPDC002668]|uniref:HEPN domain-containing protein n=1 Tax=Streptomyces sp. NPDC002668 TaxID=3154422 RepID=UPI00332246DA
MPTQRYNQLKRRIDRLDRLFLPTQSPVGSYTADEYDQVRAFIVLSHAEVEEYIEAMCLNILQKAEARWCSSAFAGACVAALMLYNDKQTKPPKSLAKQAQKDTVDEIVKSAFQKHRNLAERENHGVKEANLLRLLLPIGFKESDFDSVWLGVMNSFGANRGMVAHQSASRVQNPPDPAISRRQVQDALSGLLLLESVFARIKRR